MRFEGRLRLCLELAAAPLGDRVRLIDATALRRDLLAGLRGRHLPHSFYTWEPHIASIARCLERLPEGEFPLDVPSAHERAVSVLAHMIGTGRISFDPIEHVEFDRIADACAAATMLREYALENLLIVAAESAVRVTRLGATFQQLRGRDALAFLLALETSLCLGDADPYHASRSLLAAARTGLAATEVFDNPDFPFHVESIQRLDALGVLTLSGTTTDRYHVPPQLRDIVDAAIDGGPWHPAIRALLDDERAMMLPPPPRSQPAIEATIDLSRMMAHEVRNALVPVRLHLDALLRVEAFDPNRVTSARRGVVRVLDFVDQLVTTADLLNEPSRRCDLVVLLTEAYQRLDGHDRVSIDEPTSLYLVSVPPQRFVVALTNLLQNALQFAPPPSPIRVSWHETSDGLHIHIDDGGPGVPPADRLRIFDDGYTTRPGGSGFGLAYVRKVVESSLRGRVWCEDSDLGGARFVIAIPTKSP